MACRCRPGGKTLWDEAADRLHHRWRRASGAPTASFNVVSTDVVQWLPRPDDP
jgi:hypothetical protein